jgi:hypothetical protein
MLIRTAEIFQVVVEATIKLVFFLNVTPCLLVTHTHGTEE